VVPAPPGACSRLGVDTGWAVAVAVTIADFTRHAERSPPEATVGLLNDLFSQFDALTESRGLEKIKAVGDAYMAAGGVPDHAQAVAELALEMLEVAAGRRLPDGGPVRLRIGIDSGPVVAGVIGRRKVSYDLWGDTANTASRMETTGVPGCIQVTERTRNLLGERYRFQERGQDPGQGQGEDAHLLPEQATHHRAVANTGLVRAPQHARQLLAPGAHREPLGVPDRRRCLI
jgi:adenylate cyclase